MKNKLLILTLFCGYILCAQTSFNFGWAHGFGSATNEDSYFSKVDASGNVYITGRITGIVDFDPGPGTTTLTAGQHCFLAKYNSAGNLIWAKAMDGAGSSFGNGLGIDAANNVYVTGYFNGTVDMDPGPATLSVGATGSSDLFLSRFDINGSLVWNKTLGAAGAQVNPNDLNVSPAGDLVIGGNFDLTMDFDASPATTTLLSTGGKDAFVMKYNSSGNFQWAIGMGSNINDDQAVGLDVDPTGNVFVTGEFSGAPDFDPSIATVILTSNGAEDIFLAKYSPAGAYIWASILGGAAKEQGVRVKYNAAGEILVSGIMQSAVIDADPSPATFTLGLVGGGINNSFLGKYNANTGALIWAKNTGGTGPIGMGAYSMTSDLQNNIYLCGFFDGTNDFDFTAGTATLSPLTAPGQDIFVAKYDNLGNYILAKNIGGGSGNGNEGYCININANNEIVLSGNFVSTPDFDLSPAVFTQASSGGTDFFIAKYAQCINPTIPTLAVNATTICGIGNSTTLSITSGTLNSAVNWVWYNVSCGTSSFATGSTVAVTPGVNTNYFVKGEGGCILAGGTCASVAVTVLPLKNVAGQVTTATVNPVPGVVILYRYEGGFTKYDSLTYQTIDPLGNFTFAAVGSGSYILQAVPTATNLQTTYAGSATGWKGATPLTHGCAVNSNQNINVIPLSNFGTGPGVLTGKIVEGLKYGLKGGAVVPGGPIKGVSVKCGKNPGGDIGVEGRTSGSGSYTFSGLPINLAGESYYILVDIPGLDTNGTYHKIISVGTTLFDNLDFVADSAKITPGIFIGLKQFSTKEAEIKIYPNPTNGIINFEIQLFNQTGINISVTDVLGKEILNSSPNISNEKFQIDLSNINPGIYFMNITIGNEKRTTKIILSR